uniref:Uncharacterized protein n=1 Tax=Rangifer tarandus platyrhynchus TaxID=3082113 RepID=A0ACB0F253_RANTA|nr:unnamed protein product [Rangifer tarandus platyrhynchus]
MEISRDHPATPLLGVHPCGLQSPVRWPAAPVPLPLTVTAAWRSSGAATNPPLYALSSIYNGHTVAIQSEKVPCFRRRAAREIDVCVNQSCRSLRGSERGVPSHAQSMFCWRPRSAQGHVFGSPGPTLDASPEWKRRTGPSIPRSRAKCGGCRSPVEQRQHQGYSRLNKQEDGAGRDAWTRHAS